jgi:hypothetical protein
MIVSQFRLDNAHFLLPSHHSGMSDKESSPRQPVQKRKFSSAEDAELRSLVDKHGTKNWEEIAVFMPGRTSRQCRDRYNNYLLDSLVATPWTPEEDAIIVERFRRIGPKWVTIARLLKGRSGNHVKNRWHRHLCHLEEGLEGWHSNEGTSESEDERRDDSPLVPLCPKIQFNEEEWADFFWNMEQKMGYGCGCEKTKKA